MLKNLKKLREERRVTQKQLADVLNVSQQSINKYENHNIEPDLNTLMLMADYFDSSVDYLIGYTTLRHKIEEVQPHDLNPEEAAAMEAFRKLSPRQKAQIISLMELFLQKE